MWTKLTSSLILATLLGGYAAAAAAADIYTIYLVRHAEKVADGSYNPELTVCGKQRAGELANIFRSVKLEAVYSSGYTRTLDTARPTAEAHKLPINHYDPAKLDEIAGILTGRGQDALVVGHSDTTAVLAGLLVEEQLGEFDESIYDRIYQVVLSDNEGRIHILHQSFVCNTAGAKT